MSAPDRHLEESLGEKLRARGYTVATAESCCGGLIANRITDVPGSSAYFVGGAVTYSNDSKINVLGVLRTTVETYGAVSEETAREMAEGARKLFGADLAVAVTGIAGPGGGTSEKPVGLVYLARSSAEGTVVERSQFTGERGEVKAQTADRALEMLVEYLT